MTKKEKKSLKRRGPNQHYISQEHQSQFSITGPLPPDHPKKGNFSYKVYNYAKDNAKSPKTGELATSAVFCSNFTYEDAKMNNLLADDSVVSAEEERLAPIFSKINKFSDNSLSGDLLAKFIFHGLKKNPTIRQGIFDSLKQYQYEKITPLLNSSEFKESTKILFETRHLVLHEFLTRLDWSTTNALLPFAYFLIFWISSIDHIVLAEGNDVALSQLQEGVGKLAEIDIIKKFEKTLKDFIKLGHIKGLLDSTLDDSPYVRKLCDLFVIEIVNIKVEPLEKGLILSENPVCFIKNEAQTSSVYKYCNIEDLAAIDYILVAMSPFHAIVAKNKKTDVELNFSVITLNRIFASNADNNYISRFKDHNEFIPYIGKGKLSTSDLITDADLAILKNIPSNNLSLAEVDSMSADLLTNASASDREIYKVKIYDFFINAGFTDTLTVSPIIAKTLLEENSKSLIVISKHPKTKFSRTLKGPSNISVAKGASIQFVFKDFEKEITQVNITVYNTGISAIAACKKGHMLIYTEKLKETTKGFKWTTSGAYRGNHLAIITAYNKDNVLLLSSKIWVNVV